MDHIRLETITDSADFWNDSYTISQYVNSILNSCNVTTPVGIYVSNYDTNPCVQIDKIWSQSLNDYTNYYKILIPKIKDYYVDEKNKAWDIKLRKAYLKHEVAHIIFSDMQDYAQHRKITTQDEFILNNALEDVRIEYKFGKKFNGANDNFFDVQKHYFEKAKSNIENSKPSLNGLAFYFMYRSKKFVFNNTPSVEIYENLYQKYKNFIDLSLSELQDLILNLKNDFLGAVQSQSQPSNSDETPSPKNDSDAEKSDDDSEKDSINDFSNESGSDANDDLDSDSDSYDNSDYSNDDSTTNAEDSNETTDFSQQMADSMKESIEKEKEELEKSLQDSNLDDTPIDDGELKVFEVPSISNEEISKIYQIQNQGDVFLKFNPSSVKKYSSNIFDLTDYCNAVARKPLKVKKNFREIFYESIVSQNRKNISLLVNHFKLKFQQKKRNKAAFNKEEGLIHNESLYKMFNSSFDQRIFYAVEKSIVTKSDISFLLDFSGSMGGTRVINLIKSLIVLNEVFTKLEIPFNVFSFSGGSPSHWKFDSKIECNALVKAIQKNKNLKYTIRHDGVIDTQEINFMGKQNIFALIGKNTRANERKNILKLILKNITSRHSISSFSKNFRSNIFGGSTPEIQAVCSIYSHLAPQKLFIINDGQFDNISLSSNDTEDAIQILNKKVTNFKVMQYILKFLREGKLTFASIKDYSFFTNQLTYDFVYKISYSYSTAFRTKMLMSPTSSATDNMDNFKIQKRLLCDMLLKLSRPTSVNKDSIENENLKINVNVNAQEQVELKLTVKNKISPSIQLFSNIYDYVKKDFNVKFNFSKTEITSYDDLFLLSCFENWEALLDSPSTVRSESGAYAYKALIQSMRNVGWDVWGIGIESNSGESYIGKENFTYIMNSKDLMENLNKRVKEIV
jgi:hypothetical protein